MTKVITKNIWHTERRDALVLEIQCVPGLVLKSNEAREFCVKVQ